MDKNFIHKVLIVGVVALAGVFVFLGLQQAFHLLLLVFAGVLMAVYFRRLSELLTERTLLKNRQSLTIVIVGTLAIIGGFVRGLGARISTQAKDLQGKIPELSTSISSTLSQHEAGRRILEQGKKLQNQEGDTTKVTSTISSFFSSTFGALGDLYIVLIIAIYFTATPLLYKKTVLSVIPESKRKSSEKLLHESYVTLGKRIIGQLIAMVIIAIMTGTGLAIIGVPYVLVFAVLAGLLNFIPNFGPLIAMIPTALVALTISPAHALGVIIVYIVAQNIEGEFITPLIQQKMVNLPPAYIILFQVFMGIIAGGIGVILATPLLAVIMVWIQKLYIKPIADKS